MQEYKPFNWKVREIYDIGDSLIMVASDRISAFDHIPEKHHYGQGCRTDPNVQILVRLHQGHYSQPHDLRRSGWI